MTIEDGAVVSVSPPVGISEEEFEHGGQKVKGLRATPEMRETKAKQRASAGSPLDEQSAMVARSAEVPAQAARMRKYIQRHAAARKRGSFVPPFVLSTAHFVHLSSPATSDGKGRTFHDGRNAAKRDRRAAKAGR